MSKVQPRGDADHGAIESSGADPTILDVQSAVSGWTDAICVLVARVADMEDDGTVAGVLAALERVRSETLAQVERITAGLDQIDRRLTELERGR